MAIGRHLPDDWYNVHHRVFCQIAPTASGRRRYSKGMHHRSIEAMAARTGMLAVDRHCRRRIPALSIQDSFNRGRIDGP
jgi:hypothetical protein